MGTFAQRLTQLRERHDLKKSELASIINVSPACVSQYERGDSMPGYDILCLLSQYFGVSTDYLLGNKTNDFCYQLDDCYCNDMSYHDLLLLCSSVPREHREILLRIIAAFKVNTEYPPKEVFMLPLIISLIESPEDRDIITDFYTSHRGILYKEAWKYLSIKEDVEDVVYEALTKIIDKMEIFRDLQPAQRVQYALTTVRNLSYILLKRNNHFSFVSYDAVNFDTLVDNHLPPETTVERKQSFEHLKKVWSNLSIDDRMLLEQKYILCWSDIDLASQLGIQPSSVRMRLTRTKRKLMHELINQGITLADWE